MTFQRFLVLLMVPLLVAFPDIVAASSSSWDPISVANGDFEQGFVAVTAGGQDGQVGDGWTPLLDTCTGNAWGHFSYEIVFQRRP